MWPSSWAAAPSNAAISPGVYSLVRRTVHSTERNSAAPPNQKAMRTVSGSVPAAATFETPSRSSAQGKIDPTTAPAPIKAVWTA